MRAATAGAERFPPDVPTVLRAAGWFPGRDIGDAVDRWIAGVSYDIKVKYHMKVSLVDGASDTTPIKCAQKVFYE